MPTVLHLYDDVELLLMKHAKQLERDAGELANAILRYELGIRVIIAEQGIAIQEQIVAGYKKEEEKPDTKQTLDEQHIEKQDQIIDEYEKKANIIDARGRFTGKVK